MKKRMTNDEFLLEILKNQRDILKMYLGDRFFEVTFTKKNGDERVMRATTNLDLIHPDHHPKPLEAGKEPKKDYPQLLKVFDIEADGWRSITYGNMICLPKVLEKI